MKYMYCVCTYLLAAFCGLNPAHAATVTVSSGESIQAAIGQAATGDTILVEPGTYTGNLNFLGKAIVLQSLSGASATTLCGTGDGPVVTFNSWEQRDTILDGFRITNGTGAKINGRDYGHGGGILCIGSSPTIRNNTIEHNRADPSTSGLYGLGGGICVIDGACPDIHGNTIRYNQAESGGGVYMYKHIDPEGYGLPRILCKNNGIQLNDAQLGGGLFVCGNAHPDITGSTITGNTASAEGSEIYACADSEPTLVELLSFNAHGSFRRITITWTTASETDNAGFHLYRSERKDGAYTRITDSLITAQGNTVSGHSYSWCDRGLRNGKTYFYRLEDIDANGIASVHGPVSAAPRIIPR